MTFPAFPRPGRAPRLRAGLALLFCAVMTGWLVRFEACPHYFTGRFGGYRDLFREEVLLRSSWMRILSKGTPIGYAHTEIDVDEKSATEHYRIDSEMQLELNILNQLQRVFTRMQVTLDILSRLQQFEFTLHTDAYETHITGRRLDGDRFRIFIKAGGENHTQTLSIPDDVILHSPMLEQSLGSLKPGEERVFKALDPASLAVSDVRVRADRRETITVRGGAEEAVVVSADYHGMTVWSWINPQGELLRQETPLGWSMEACLPEEALDYRNRGGAPQPELLASAAVPSDRPLPDARGIRRLELLLRGVEIPASELATDRQTVLGADTNGIRLRIRAEEWPAQASDEPASAFSNHLAATPFIQSDDARIRDQAAAIVRGIADPGQAAQAINDWVFKAVRKNPAASLPSAVAVLQAKEGDCNEHAYLTVALLRAAGIPAKIVSGVVYMNGAFYYHAWVGVRSGGRWVEMDPTFGQPVADATHVALAEGELQGQARLLRTLGRLTIAILEADKDLTP